MELVIIIVILGALYAIFEAKIKGIIGEKAVAVVMSGLPKEQYRVLNDIMLRTAYGTTQIDHVWKEIYISKSAETKLCARQSTGRKVDADRR